MTSVANETTLKRKRPHSVESPQGNSQGAILQYPGLGVHRHDRLQMRWMLKPQVW